MMAGLWQSRESADFIFAVMRRMKKQYRRLRTVKNRPAKPFAVMARDVEAVKQECLVNEVQEEILDGHQKPILLLEKKICRQYRSLQVCRSGESKSWRHASICTGSDIVFQYDDGIEMPDFS